MSDELLELALRIEAASGPDRTLDGLITVAIDGDRRTILYNEPGPFPQKPVYGPIRDLALSGADLANYINAPAYTTSLDAAMTLVPDGWYGRVEPRFYSDDGEVRWRGYAIKPDWSRWTPHDDWFEVVGEEPTITASKPPLALTAAALRARASHLRMEVE